MKKCVFVINGAGGVGKDTLCAMAAEVYRVQNISSITPIKEIAALCGWDGQKDDKSRKFLSDLKALCVAYNDYPTRWAKQRYEEFMRSGDDILFVHIREPSEIEKFVRATDGAARTLLIRGGSRVSRVPGGYGNVSDDRVEEYPYDYIFLNDQPIPQTRKAFLSFLRRLVNEESFGNCE